jgi:hypothetical protein
LCHVLYIIEGEPRSKWTFAVCVCHEAILVITGLHMHDKKRLDPCWHEEVATCGDTQDSAKLCYTRL